MVIYFVYIGIRNVIQTGFGLYFTTFRFIWCFIWHDIFMVMLTLNSCHDLVRVWRNKDVIPMVMLPFPPSYYHCHYNIFNFFSPIESVIHDSIWSEHWCWCFEIQSYLKEIPGVICCLIYTGFQNMTKLPFIMGDPLLLLPYHCR